MSRRLLFRSILLTRRQEYTKNSKTVPALLEQSDQNRTDSDQVVRTAAR